MKITREQQLQALQERDKARARQTGSADAFSALLTKELHTQQPAAKPVDAAPRPVGTMVVPVAAGSEGSVSASGQEAAESINAMCATLEQYAGQLENTANADLRTAYGLLESVSGQLREFKERFAEGIQENPGLAEAVNELEVLATTERFKFNRGDYL